MNKRFATRMPRSVLAVALFGLALPIASAPAAIAAPTTGTATITAGSLSLTPPTVVTFTAGLNGIDQVVTQTQALDVLDSTGSGSGWSLTATSTQFKTAGTDTLATGAVQETSGPTQSCDGGNACTLATPNVGYPYTLPAATSAPTATKFYNALAGTGLGNQTSVHTMRLSVPASTKAGTYSSTWTYSFVSGP